MTEERLGAHRIALRADADLDAACARFLLVGELNPISSDPRHALHCAPAGCSGHRLQSRILALPARTYLSVWRTNLCVGQWDMARAVSRARVLLTGTDLPWSVVVCLGARVAVAAGRATGQSLDASTPELTRLSDRMSAVAVPHPSGMCRAWNDPDLARRVRILLASSESAVPWGDLPSP